MSASVLQWREHAGAMVWTKGLPVWGVESDFYLTQQEASVTEVEKLVEEVVVLGFLVTTISGLEVYAHFFTVPLVVREASCGV